MRGFRYKALVCAIWLCLGSDGLAQTDSPDNWITVTENPVAFRTGLIPAEASAYQSIQATPLFRDFLPLAIDLTDRFPSVGDQGQMASCVAWAVGYAARSYYAHTREDRPRNSAHHIPSPAFIYHSVRPNDCDDGSRISDALDLLKTGAVSLARAPYSDRSCNRPSAGLRQVATDFRIDGWDRVDFQNPDQVKAQLANGSPVIIAMTTTPDSFVKPASRTGVYEWDGQAGEPDSGHAVIIVGYDDNRQAFRLMNSWGRDWGDEGFLWISYESVTKLVGEAYTMRPVSAPPVPLPPLPSPPDPVIGELDLDNVRCSKLSVEVRDGRHVVSGFVGYAADLARIRASLTGKPVDLDVQLAPWPQCEVLLTMADILNVTGGPEIAMSGRDAFFEGEKLLIDITTPGYASYVYLSYIQADGSVIHLDQPRAPVPTPHPAYQTVSIGNGDNGPRFSVSPPYGREMIIVLAAKSPLFEAPLPRAQTEREYLTAVRKAVLALPTHGGNQRIVSGAVAAFVTMERRP